MKNVMGLVKLIQDNPNLPVYTVVESEVVASGHYGRWVSKIGSSVVDRIYFDDDRYYVESYDDEDLEEKFAEIICEHNPNITDNDLELRIDVCMRALEWEDCIVVNVDTL